MKKSRFWLCNIVCVFGMLSAACGIRALQARSFMPVRPEINLLPTRSMRAETIYMVRCMEEFHLEHKDISMLDNKSIILEFCSTLDPWKTVFLQKDVDSLVAEFVSVLDIFVGGGSLFPAFRIFEDFREMAYDRMDWVFERLDHPFDFSMDDTFFQNKKESNWPQTTEEADILWEKRLKFEILNEAIALCKTGKKSSGKSPSKGDSTASEVSEANDTSTSGDVCASGNACAASSVCTEDEIIEKLPEAAGNIKRRYESWRRSWKDVDPWLIQEMFLNSISKMYDPHTSFLSKDSFEDFTIMIHNSLIGIGAELRDENGVCTVNKLIPGGPAKLSGEIKSGDKIIAVAQGDSGEFVDIIGLRLYKTVKLLRGKKDTVVRIKLETVSGDTKVVRLVRDTIKMNETRASAKYFEMERNGKTVKIGVIELPSFYGDPSADDDQCAYADRDVGVLIEALRQRGIEGLILDLRQNGGGLLQQAVSITGLFIETGPVVQVKDTYGNIEKLCDENESIAWDGPLIVLSSSMSASASEILIGALRDHGRAIIVGAESTYGKGSVQVALDMNRVFNSLNGDNDLGAAYITVQKWYLPTGTSTQLKGVPAHIKLSGLDECFHRKEADYPHALGCDAIPPIEFERKWTEKKTKFAVTDLLIDRLNKKSKTRQESMEEFRIFRKRVDHFDSVVNRKEFPLKISTRLAEKRSEDEFKSEITEQIKVMAESQDYPYEYIELPDIKRDSDTSTEEKSHEDVDGIVLFDTNLRESLRIIIDWVSLLGETRPAPANRSAAAQDL